MQRISQSTFFYKRVFPTLWFGFIAFFVCVALFASPRQPALLPAIIVPVVMAIFGYFLFKKLLFDLADEVLDEGDFLVVRFGKDIERIPLANIMNIGYTIMMNPPRVTLTLRQPSRFGKEVSFSPPRRWFSFSSSPIIKDLIERVDAARMR